jgi:hypothetical protein
VLAMIVPGICLQYLLELHNAISFVLFVALFLILTTSSFYHGVLQSWQFPCHHYPIWQLDLLLALCYGVVVVCCSHKDGDITCPELQQ